MSDELNSQELNIKNLSLEEEENECSKFKASLVDLTIEELISAHNELTIGKYNKKDSNVTDFLSFMVKYNLIVNRIKELNNEEVKKLTHKFILTEGKVTSEQYGTVSYNLQYLTKRGYVKFPSIKLDLISYEVSRVEYVGNYSNIMSFFYPLDQGEYDYSLNGNLCVFYNLLTSIFLIACNVSKSKVSVDGEIMPVVNNFKSYKSIKEDEYMKTFIKLDTEYREIKKKIKRNTYISILKAYNSCREIKPFVPESEVSIKNETDDSTTIYKNYTGDCYFGKIKLYSTIGNNKVEDGGRLRYVFCERKMINGEPAINDKGQPIYISRTYNANNELKRLFPKFCLIEDVLYIPSITKSGSYLSIVSNIICSANDTNGFKSYIKYTKTGSKYEKSEDICMETENEEEYEEVSTNNKSKNIIIESE